MTTAPKYVYLFGTRHTDGAASMKNLLGGKGANLAEMCRLGIPVPPGFTISTEACTAYTQLGRQQGRDALLAMIDGEVREGVAASASATRPTRCCCRCARAHAPRCRG